MSYQLIVPKITFVSGETVYASAVTTIPHVRMRTANRYCVRALITAANNDNSAALILPLFISERSRDDCHRQIDNRGFEERDGDRERIFYFLRRQRILHPRANRKNLMRPLNLNTRFFTDTGKRDVILNHPPPHKSSLSAAPFPFRSTIGDQKRTRLTSGNRF